MREEASDEGGAAGKEAAKPRDQPELDDDGDEHDAGHSAAKIKSKSSGMTESEQRYEAIRKQRLAEKVRKEAKKSHKERVAEFNDKLEGMSEHYDLPRVRPAGLLPLGAAIADF